MTKSERARLMKAEHPELTDREIGAATGLRDARVREALSRQPRRPYQTDCRVIGVTLTRLLNRQLRAECRASGRSIADIVREALRRRYRTESSASGEETRKAISLA